MQNLLIVYIVFFYVPLLISLFETDPIMHYIFFVFGLMTQFIFLGIEIV